MTKWPAPNGFTCNVHQMDLRADGSFRMSCHNFTTGHGRSFGGRYLDVVPGEHFSYPDKFDELNLPGENHVTITLRKVSFGRQLGIV